ncbi:MAG: zinc-dependent alcohol dehydrogenase family protein [Rhizobiaceae bacterium]|nr:zinc-dependent alcohol dehydrogenase family protein [Rhizobiaceae bacterium]
MRAMYFERFGERPVIRVLPDPAPARHGVVVKVDASGVCRSDWHGWLGHDPDIVLPHVPGHELAGTIVAVGSDVARFRVGERITVPFVSGCGRCGECRSGNHQVCPNQEQPGFTYWGSFAEYVGIHYADTNLVHLPEELDFATAASLGCRFATSFRAVVDQARTRPGEWVAVHGCGGVGLSAIMIASALGANVVAIDLDPAKLDFAAGIGADAVVDASGDTDVVAAVKEITGGGAHVSIDALGHRATSFNSIRNLRRRGRHVQIGLMLGEDAAPTVPMAQIIGHELEIYGSHGMQAWRYDEMLAMIASGRLSPQKLVGRRITLDEAIDALVSMDRSHDIGINVITSF